MCGFGDLGALDLLQGVDALALVVESVHQMHIDGWMFLFVRGCRKKSDVWSLVGWSLVVRGKIRGFGGD